MTPRRTWARLALLLLACTRPGFAAAQVELDAEADLTLEAEPGSGSDANGDAEPGTGAADAEPEMDAESDLGLDSPAEATEPGTQPEPGTAVAEAEPEPGTVAAEEPVRAISLYMAAGLGVGTLSFTKPTESGVQYLPESAFAAAEALARVHVWPSEALSLEAQIAYQTSLGFELELSPLFALPERVAARSQRVELSFGPRFAFTSAKRGLAVAVPLGFALRSFFPEVHYYTVTTHNLGSFFVKPELIVPLGELLTLRGGPQLHWLTLIEPALEREGATAPGYALGFQAAVQASVGDTFSVALAYHELHSVIPAAARFEDTERFLTARFGGGL